MKKVFIINIYNIISYNIEFCKSFFVFRANFKEKLKENLHSYRLRQGHKNGVRTNGNEIRDL